ncbi:MAG: hypothetical protein JF622_15375, partial [Terrabacter sp.]|nr:hypothetical protein [Terrabacter sp.]
RIHLARMGFNTAAVRPANAAKVVALAVDGIARACVDDPEERLVKLLRDGIDVVATFAPLAPEPVRVTWAVPESTPASPEPIRQARSLTH